MYSRLFLVTLFVSYVCGSSYNNIKIDDTTIITQNISVDYVNGKCFIDGKEIKCARCDKTANLIFGNSTNMIAYCNNCVDELVDTPKLSRKK